MIREHLVDQRLIADVSAARFLAERLEDARINADRDQSAQCVTKRLTGAELLIDRPEEPVDAWTWLTRSACSRAAGEMGLKARGSAVRAGP